MSDEKRKVGRPKKGAGGTEERLRFSVDAAPSVVAAWKREARRQEISVADLFEKIGETFPKVIIV